MSNKKRVCKLIIGPILFVLCSLILPSSIFSGFSSKAAIGVVVWMAFWWVTGAVDYAVTAFLPIALNALLQMSNMSSVIANYASETIMLLLGASILVVSWEETGLDNRIATKFLGIIGRNYKGQLIFWFLLSAILSAFLPNAVVCATITPLAVAMLKYVGEADIVNSKKGAKLLLYIAYATGIGGLASPLGGAMNLVTVNYLQDITGEEYLYSSWVIRFLPIVILLIVASIIFMIRDVEKGEVLGDTRGFFVEQYKNLPPITKKEIESLSLFIVAVVMSFTRKMYQDVLPGLKPAYVFIICAILSFLITGKDGKRVMRWKVVQTKIEWELLFIFAGGMAAGTLMSDSGAVADIGAAVSAVGLKSGFIIVFAIIVLTLLLSDVTSNTATAAIAIPTVISIIQGIGENPIPYVYIASIGVNLSFMLPTSIRAIPVGYGLTPKYMFSEGWKISVIVIILMALLGYALLCYWPVFSTI